jgi:EAL domain-containing protein (putative c-di-GMP-specific phosphodiesterase class I)
MHAPALEHLLACESCRNGDPLGFEFTMAFQPIVDIRDRTVFAYEALVRGRDGAGAASVLAQVTAENMYRFDQACRTKAVELASRLGVECYLSINFMPNAIYEPATCIRTTLAAAKEFDFPLDHLIFEVSEREDAVDRAHLTKILKDYSQRGFKTAIDDFGAGYAGLGLLVDFQPHFIKIDMSLLRGIDADPVRQAVVTRLIQMCRDLGVDVIAEGIETLAEYEWFLTTDVRYAQGYLFARPGFEMLPEVVWPS